MVMGKWLTTLAVLLLLMPCYADFDIPEGVCAGLTDSECTVFCSSNPGTWDKCAQQYSQEPWWQYFIESGGAGQYSADKIEKKGMGVLIEGFPSLLLKPGETLEEIYVKFYLKEGTEQKPINPKDIRAFESYILGESYYINDFAVDDEKQALVLSIGKKFDEFEFADSMAMQGDNMDYRIEVHHAEDIHGNIFQGGAFAQVEFDLSADGFRIIARNHQTTCFGTGQDILVTVRADEKELTNASAFLVDTEKKSFIDCDFLPEKSSELNFKFSCPVQIPTERDILKMELFYGIMATAQIEGQNQSAMSFVYLHPGNNIDFDSVYPERGQTDVPGDPAEAAKFKVRIRCVDNQALLGVNSLRAKVNGKEVVLKKNTEENYFEAANVFTGITMGEPFDVSLELMDDFSDNEFSFTTFFTNDGFGPRDTGPGEGPGMIDILFLAGIPVLVSLIFLGFFALRHRRETKEALLTQRDELKGLLKRIEVEYYKRRVTEEEFKKRALEYQQKLRMVEVKLGLKNDATAKKQSPAK